MAATTSTRPRHPRRGDHGQFDPPADRRDPIAILEEQALDRAPELVPIRHGRMLASPFAFFRGAAAIMAADLASTPALGVEVQLCGDAHLSNFGIFAAPDRRLVFDVNDFDETHPGPWEWDVKRLAASIAVLGRDRAFSAGRRRDLVTAMAEAYRAGMRGFATSGALDVWYTRVDLDAMATDPATALTPSQLRYLQSGLAKARRKDSSRALSKLTYTTPAGETPKIVSDPPLVLPLANLVADDRVAETRAALEQVFDDYRASIDPDRRHLIEGYRGVDMAHKVVGVGSVGLRAWIVLLLGDRDDPLFLQLKEARPSVLAPHVDRQVSGNQGRRVVQGQRMMQSASDIFLGWTRADHDLDGPPRDYYVRQLWDAKGSAPVDTGTVPELLGYVRLCGWTLARAHARSGDRHAIADYVGRGGRFDRALVTFAEAYADVNAADHQALVDAVASGRVRAQTGR